LEQREHGPKVILRNRKQRKRKNLALMLIRSVQGLAAFKLEMFVKLRAADGFANEVPAKLTEAEKMLRAFAAMEKGTLS
jgi:hypothetical protein